MSENQSETGTHPIQIAARRSGLNQDVIRAWERRYSAVTPGRTPTNRRTYTDEDVERLFLLARVTRAGRRIGDVAGLSLDKLRTMVADDTQMSTSPIPVPDRELLEVCLDAIERLDADALRKTLAAASVAMTVPGLLQELLVPLLATVGERWRSGKLRIAHEHMAASIIRSFLGALREARSPDGSAPELIVATPARQRHELGAMMVAVMATTDGWRVTYLGADTPVPDIAAAALVRNAKAVALSLVYPADDSELRDELRQLRSLLNDNIPIVVGGAASRGYADTLSEIGASAHGDLTGFLSDLRSLRQSP